LISRSFAGLTPTLRAIPSSDSPKRVTYET
jgi:hypothetical protein